MFPHGSGYYEELENIWYNKYGGDMLKTEKKIRQLKTLMVQKLIFQPLVEYAQSKLRDTKSLDNWFSPIENDLGNVNNVSKANISGNETIKKEKSKHEVKVKKTKQMSLDAFF